MDDGLHVVFVTTVSDSHKLRHLVGSTARGEAASALRELCRAAAPRIAAARALVALMSTCEEAVASSVGVSDRGLEMNDRLAIVQGLAAVAGALPSEEAHQALVHLTSTAVLTVTSLAEGQVIFPFPNFCSIVEGVIELRRDL